MDTLNFEECHARNDAAVGNFELSQGQAGALSNRHRGSKLARVSSINLLQCRAWNLKFVCVRKA